MLFLVPPRLRCATAVRQSGGRGTARPERAVGRGKWASRGCHGGVGARVSRGKGRHRPPSVAHLPLGGVPRDKGPQGEWKCEGWMGKGKRKGKRGKGRPRAGRAARRPAAQSSPGRIGRDAPLTALGRGSGRHRPPVHVVQVKMADGRAAHASGEGRRGGGSDSPTSVRSGVYFRCASPPSVLRREGARVHSWLAPTTSRLGGASTDMSQKNPLGCTGVAVCAKDAEGWCGGQRDTTCASQRCTDRCPCRE